MRTLNTITLILVAIGGINWGLVGLFDLNLVALLFGEDTVLSTIVYTLVGLSALWQLFSFRWTLDHETDASYATMRERRA
jgi:uncharacterized protein